MVFYVEDPGSNPAKTYVYHFWFQEEYSPSLAPMLQKKFHIRALEWENTPC